MKMKDILNLISTLAQSQGFYGRLYRSLMEAKQENPEAYNALTAEWEAQNFSSDLDFILYIEC